ncbi:hypothetical protein [Prochlorococcus sp. MIT 1341]|uniref:hypothetical protein n=1 Tax=Prochlorococcus sp. MIT 1341 TaxID=3096221 RepID=UPI002A75DE41|nr:hypothetical protein [Prochlorococcus sp. MIT 1341]
MAIQEDSEKRKDGFRAMSSDERKTLIREKMKALGLQEGSGVPGRDLSSYDRDEIWDLIQLTGYFPEMQNKPRAMKAKAPSKKKSLINWILIAIALTYGMALYYQQYPSPETRRELSVDGMFAD